MLRVCSALALTALVLSALPAIAHALSPAPTSRPMQPTAGRRAAKLLKRVRPKYSPAAIKANIEGIVIVLVRIAPDGLVNQAKLVKGLGYGLDAAALDAVKKWVFKPAMVDGAPVSSAKRLRVQFVIEE